MTWCVNCRLDGAVPSLPLWGEVPYVRRIGALALWENESEPFRETPVHAHEQTSLTVGFKGHGVEWLGSRTIERNAGILYCRVGGQEHRIRVGTVAVRCVNVMLDEQWLDRLPGVQLRDMEIDRGAAVWTAARLLEELREWSIGSALAAEGIVLEMINLLAVPRRLRIDATMPAWVGRVEELLRSELDHDVSMSHVAERVDVDPLVLGRTWRRFKGCSLAQSANALRIERATKLILEGADSLGAIAAKCGFSHATRFSRIFQEIAGMTPLALRALCR